MNVTQLEVAIAGLPKEEQFRLAEWLDEFIASRWDRQIEEDAAAGKLNKILEKVDADIDRGLSTPL